MLSGGCASVTRKIPLQFSSMTTQQKKTWQYDWRRLQAERPTEQNAEVFHSYVEMAWQLLEEFSSADFVYSEVRKVCQPRYLFQVIADMRSEKLTMVIRDTESGLKVVSICKVRG